MTPLIVSLDFYDEEADEKFNEVGLYNANTHGSKFSVRLLAFPHPHTVTPD